jgi:quercetin dioxygenase-like cupin family protein
VKQHVHRLAEVFPTQVRPDLAGRVYEGDDLTLVRWEFAPGTPRTGMHVHAEHEQFGVVLQGEIEMQIGEEVVRLGAGDLFWCPRNVPHGRTLVLGDVAAQVLDVFTPPRADYVSIANAAGEQGTGNQGTGY